MSVLRSPKAALTAASVIAVAFGASSQANAQIYGSLAQLAGTVDTPVTEALEAAEANTPADSLDDDFSDLEDDYGIGTIGAGGSSGETVRDPWENLNRKMFGVNIFFDDNFLVPVAKGYRAVTPKFARKGIRNFLANIRSPGIFVNDILQGEFKRAGETLGRFVVNSTIGIGGFTDPATNIGIPGHNEDFGQTLAVWGVPSGPYTFFPFFGPGTVRSSIGNVGQIALNPLTFIDTPPANIAQYTTTAVGAVSAREQFIEPLQDIRENSLDYYASFRSFYLQARKREIANGRTSFDDLPDIGDFEEFDELEAELDELE